MKINISTTSKSMPVEKWSNIENPYDKTTIKNVKSAISRYQQAVDKKKNPPQNPCHKV